MYIHILVLHQLHSSSTRRHCSSATHCCFVRTATSLLVSYFRRWHVPNSLFFFFRIRLPPFQRRLSTYYAFVFFFYGAIIVSTRLNYRIPTYSLVYTVVLGIDYYETGSPLGAELRRPSFTLTLSFNFTSLFLFLFFVLSCLLLLLLLFHLPSDNVQRLFQSSTQTCSSSI